MGRVHIYCGEGKGKTTAAVGLAVRLAGSGGRAVIVRFLKNDNSGEVAGLRQVEGITVIPCEKSFGFTWQMSSQQKKEASEVYTRLLKQAEAESRRLCQEESESGRLCQAEAESGRLCQEVTEGRRLCQASAGPVLLILDEVCAAVTAGLLSEQSVTELLDTRPENLEVVLTGRGPTEEFLNRADYISRIEKVRHPFDDGLAARKGIEF